MGVRKLRNPLFFPICNDPIFSITSIYSFPSLEGRGLRGGCFYPFLHPHLCPPPSRGRIVRCRANLEVCFILCKAKALPYKTCSHLIYQALHSKTQLIEQLHSETRRNIILDKLFLIIPCLNSRIVFQRTISQREYKLKTTYFRTPTAYYTHVRYFVNRLFEFLTYVNFNQMKINIKTEWRVCSRPSTGGERFSSCDTEF